MKRQLFSLLMLSTFSCLLEAKVPSGDFNSDVAMPEKPAMSGKVKKPSKEEKEENKKPKVLTQKEDQAKSKEDDLRKKTIVVEASLHSHFALKHTSEPEAVTLGDEDKNILRQLKRSYMSTGDKDLALKLDETIIKGGDKTSETLEESLKKAKKALKEYNDAVTDKKEKLPYLEKDDTLTTYALKTNCLDLELTLEELEKEYKNAVPSGKKAVREDIDATKKELKASNEQIDTIKKSAKNAQKSAQVGSKKAEAALTKAAQNKEVKESSKVKKIAVSKTDTDAVAALAAEDAAKEQQKKEQKKKKDEKQRVADRVNEEKQARREESIKTVIGGRTNARKALSQTGNDSVADSK